MRRSIATRESAATRHTGGDPVAFVAIAAVSAHRALSQGESWRRLFALATQRATLSRVRRPTSFRARAGVALFYPSGVDRSPFEGARRSCRSESRWRPPTMGTCTTTSICRCAIGRRGVASRAAHDRTRSRVVGVSRAERCVSRADRRTIPTDPKAPRRDRAVDARASTSLARL